MDGVSRIDIVCNRILRGRPGQPQDDTYCGLTIQLNSTTYTAAMKIRTARSDDLEAVKAMLTENDLPASDITEDLLSDFAVAEDVDGSVVGCVGLERFGAIALLRSLTVGGTARNAGLGSRLRAHAEDLARANEISELWLLTTTAADFFARAGYVVTNRGRAPAELQASKQFAHLCPATAVCLKKSL
ncbi:arsenic resistance N-acetyltransferase ArsN2 [Paraburkholderia lacunae]|nr:arsenic resistance N-acetyltransferase ArsN2 [Paraburkholderia lacunae]